MRPYRGLTKEGKWVYGYYCCFRFWGRDIIMTDNPPNLEDNIVDPKTVGQFTGLKDWYAGDIIQKGTIIRAITVDWEHGLRFMLGKHQLCKQDAINGKKIGNIHSNPKLLEKEND